MCVQGVFGLSTVAIERASDPLSLQILEDQPPVALWGGSRHPQPSPHSSVLSLGCVDCTRARTYQPLVDMQTRHHLG